MSKIYKKLGIKKKRTQLINEQKFWTDLFFKRKHTAAQQTCGKMLNNTNISEIQIKITRSYHLTPARMTIIKKTTNNVLEKM